MGILHDKNAACLFKPFEFVEVVLDGEPVRGLQSRLGRCLGWLANGFVAARCRQANWAEHASRTRLANYLSNDNWLPSPCEQVGSWRVPGAAITKPPITGRLERAGNARKRGWGTLR